jgi:hypothetical protein
MMMTRVLPRKGKSAPHCSTHVQFSRASRQEQHFHEDEQEDDTVERSFDYS